MNEKENRISLLAVKFFEGHKSYPSVFVIMLSLLFATKLQSSCMLVVWPEGECLPLSCNGLQKKDFTMDTEILSFFAVCVLLGRFTFTCFPRNQSWEQISPSWGGFPLLDSCHPNRCCHLKCPLYSCSVNNYNFRFPINFCSADNGHQEK